MPLEVIQNEVKDRWRIDVNPSIMYRARKKVNRKIYGKQEGQYTKLWDYCETLRRTSARSCVMMKVEKPSLEVNPMFQRLYCSLTTIKKGFFQKVAGLW